MTLLTKDACLKGKKYGVAAVLITVVAPTFTTVLSNASDVSAHSESIRVIASDVDENRAGIMALKESIESLSMEVRRSSDIVMLESMITRHDLSDDEQYRASIKQAIDSLQRNLDK